jgi:putative membrane protein
MKESMDDMDKASVRFIKDAGNGNLEEIAMGKLAQTNGNYGRVKDFAARMVAAHQVALDKLQKASYSSGITVPVGSSDNDVIRELAEKKGNEFDKDYINKMVDAHQQMADMLDKARRNINDTGLARYASEMLPEVQAHLQEARVIQEDVRKLKINRPEQGDR